MNEKFTQTFGEQQCEHCIELQKENRLIRNKLITLQQKFEKQKVAVVDLKSSMYTREIEKKLLFTYHIVHIIISQHLHCKICLFDVFYDLQFLKKSVRVQVKKRLVSTWV